eukprot:TRINITY_DN71325_c1_g1_i1.p2 TRINITY_DN71325_c1_g1~~TRINITY_DN71325_c1_g1_i1.p2  ORF type:complete len:357 (+),score=42.80 TRINITY_DN71325_c1_g1_i1:108-1073(+)
MKKEEEDATVEECVYSISHLFEGKEHFHSQFESILKRDKGAPLRITIPLKAVSGHHDYSSRSEDQEGVSMMTYDSKRHSNKVTVLPLTERRHLDRAHGLSEGNSGGEASPVREIYLLKHRLKQDLQVPKRLIRNSPEVYSLKPKDTPCTTLDPEKIAAYADKSSNIELPKELKLPVLKKATTKSAPRSTRRGDSITVGAKVSPYYIKNNVRHYSPQKAKQLMNNFRTNIEVRNSLAELPKAEKPTLFSEFTGALSKNMEEMHKEAKKKAMENADNLLNVAQAEEKERMFYWSPDMNLYGFATKEAVVKQMRVWRKKAPNKL